MEPGLLGEGGSAMPVRALPPALERLAEVAEVAPPTLPPGGPDTATVVMEERISLDSDSQQMFMTIIERFSDLTLLVFSFDIAVDNDLLIIFPRLDFKDPAVSNATILF